MVNPGLCHSELALKGGDPLALKIMKFFLARTTEQGSRNYLAATEAGEESHGEYMSACRVEEVAPLVRSEVGKEVQARVWEQLNGRLERIEKGVVGNV